MLDFMTFSSLSDLFVPSITLLLLVSALAPLGCFLVWQRMAFFSDGLSHACTLGVPLALLMHVHLLAGIAFIAACIVCAWLALESKSKLSLDSIFALLAYTSFAGAVVLLSITGIEADLEAVLIGDFFAIGKVELAVAFFTFCITMTILKRYWKPFVLYTLSPDLARVMTPHMNRLRIMQMLLSAAMVALGMHSLGASLLPGLMIFPPCCARLLSTSPLQMVVLSIGFAVIGSLSGIGLSLSFGAETSPMIIVCGGVLFLISLSVSWFLKRQKKQQARTPL